jgi:hypothetical protein
MTSFSSFALLASPFYFWSSHMFSFATAPHSASPYSAAVAYIPSKLGIQPRAIVLFSDSFPSHSHLF